MTSIIYWYTWHFGLILKFVLKDLIIFEKELFENIIIFFNPRIILTFCHYMVNLKNFTWLAVLIGLIYLRKRPKEAIFFILITFISINLSELTVNTLKHIFKRPRPMQQFGIFISNNNFAFPSAHAFNTMSMAVLFGNWFRQKRLWFIAFSILVGLCRMTGGWHLPFDILVGWVLGFLFGHSLSYFWEVILQKYFIFQRRYYSG